MIRLDVELSFDRKRDVWFVSRSTLPGVLGDQSPKHETLSEHVAACARAAAGSNDYSINISGKRGFSWPRLPRIFRRTDTFVSSESRASH